MYKNEKGLTLVELLAVIVILAVVAMIAVPSISGIIEKSKVDAAKADAIQIINAAELYDVSTNEGIPVCIDSNGEGQYMEASALKGEGYLENIGKYMRLTDSNQSADGGMMTRVCKKNNGILITGDGVTGKYRLTLIEASKLDIDEEPFELNQVGPVWIQKQNESS